MATFAEEAQQMLSDQELDAMEQRLKGLPPRPWRATIEGRDHTSGDSFIMTGEGPSRGPDIYVSVDGRPATTAFLDAIAAAPNDLARLIAEIRALRSSR